MGSLARLRYSSKNLALPWHWAKSLCKMWQDNAFVLIYFRVDKLLVLTKIKMKAWKVPKTNICTCKSTKILQYSVSLHFLLNQTFFSLIWCTKPKNTHNRFLAGESFYDYHFSGPPLISPLALTMLKYSPLGSFFSNSNFSCWINSWNLWLIIYYLIKNVGKIPCPRRSELDSRGAD